MKVIVDGDACPVLKIIFEICEKTNTDCTVVHDFCHEIDCGSAKEFVVDKESDSADFKILSVAKKGDVVLTDDYGLAALCLAKKCKAMSFCGKIYDDKNIDGLLMSRHIGKKMIRAGKRFKGKQKRSEEENTAFANALEKILSDL